MVLKSELEIALKRQKELLEKKSSGLVRDLKDKVKLSQTYVLIITGVRRCGKSTLMRQLSGAKGKNKTWYNFEDPRAFGFQLSDFSKLDEIIGDDTTHYFFDEIQNVENWEVFIRELHDREKVVCVTGSNASLLSRELGTKLTGRNIQIELFPFSFSEYCRFLKRKMNVESFNDYLEVGGFPDYVKTEQKEYLQQLFRDIVYRDIIVRHAVRHSSSLVQIALFLISNVGKEYSLNSIRKTFDVGSTNSIANYVQWLEDSYVLFTVPRFSWSLKSVAINPKKVYTIDTGFAQANSLSYTEDKGRLFENTIFLELRRKYKEIFYFRENGECDFVVKEGKKIHFLIQVCTEVTTDNLKRELKGLTEAMNFFKLKTGTIITLNQEDCILENGKEINLVPAWKWLTEFKKNN